MNNYILIPNDIKTSSIPSGAKILYGDILCLSKRGYCFSSNKYFAKTYNVHTNSISNWITSLKENKFINAKYGKDDKGRSVRKLYPTIECGKKHKKLLKGHTKIYEHNNKRDEYKRKTKVVI